MFFFFQAEDGIRDLVRSRGLGDVYKRQGVGTADIQTDPNNPNQMVGKDEQGNLEPAVITLNLSLIHI